MSDPVLNDRFREFLLRRRQALLIELGGIEDYLGMDRTVVPKRKQRATPEEIREKFDQAVRLNASPLRKA